MKLSFKIMTAVMLVIAALLVIHSYLVVQRELSHFRDDMNLHAYLLGSVLASSVSDIWRSGGPDRVQSIIEDANQSEHLISVRLVWFDVPRDDPSAPRIDPKELSSMTNGEETLVPTYSYQGSDYHIAYFPVTLDSSRFSALELSQPLAPMQRYMWITILQKVALFVAFLLVGGGLVWWLGVHLVGRPVQIMVAQAHSVGGGDLDVRNELENSKDEIGQLARGLNDMVADLRLVRARLDEETAQRIAAIEQLNHAERLATVGKLASGLAHELGTPLNVVVGRAKMIVSGEVQEAEIVDSATVIQNQADRMTNIIRQLLDFARSKPLEKRVGELAQPVDEVVRMLAPILKDNKVNCEVNQVERITVEIDVNRIQQVLSNLIVNALHAMPDGGRIVITHGRKQAKPPADSDAKEGDYAFIEVADTGAGIPSENLSRIFTPFFSTKQVGEGTGLGLSITHGIIKEHGGWLTVQSEVGKGSTFTIHLPIAEET